MGQNVPSIATGEHILLRFFFPFFLIYASIVSLVVSSAKRSTTDFASCDLALRRHGCPIGYNSVREHDTDEKGQENLVELRIFIIFNRTTNDVALCVSF